MEKKVFATRATKLKHDIFIILACDTILWMDGVQLSQGYRATRRRQLTFYYSVSRNFGYSTGRPWKDERLS